MIRPHRAPTTNAWLGVMKELLHLLQQSGTMIVNNKIPLQLHQIQTIYKARLLDNLFSFQLSEAKNIGRTSCRVFLNVICQKTVFQCAHMKVGKATHLPCNSLFSECTHIKALQDCKTSKFLPPSRHDKG